MAVRRPPFALEISGESYPTEPSISSSIRRLSSTLYSIGNWRTRSLTNPFTLKLIACASVSPALLHVENLLRAHLADAGFVLNGVAGTAHGDCRVGIGATGRVNQERVALGVILAILEMLRHVHQTAVSGAAFADGDAFGNDVASSLISRVDHLRAGILMLAVIGESDRENFAARFAPLHDHAGIFHCQARADIAIDPLYLGIFLGQTAFRHQVENIRRPVLDGDVLDLGAFERDQFDDCAVQRRGIKLWRCATFHVGHFRTFIGDDERTLELAKIFGVDAEISLERMFHFHPRRDVNERAAAEHSGIQGAEFIVADWDDLAEPFPENLGMILEALG